MDKENKQLKLFEKWELDIKSYKERAKVETAVPQCEKCKYYIKGDALHCKRFKDERKPQYVIFIEKECPSFCSNNSLNLGVLNEFDQKIYGGIFGLCVGDMLGVPVEFSTREERDADKVKELRAYGTYHQPFGTWSDDTSMTLCLIDAINKGFSLEKLADNFIKYIRDASFTPNGNVFDIGISAQNAIKKMIMGIAPVKCGGIADTDNGNGSLMRILPLAYMNQKLNTEELIKMVEDVSSLTHAHNRAKLACIIYVEFASQLILGRERKDAYDCLIELISKHCNDKYCNEIENFSNILNKKVIGFNKTQIRSTGYVIDTLEAVFWLFFNSNSYEQMVIEAVNLGGDTDTIAAVTGGLAGIYFGFNSIPDSWVQNIERKCEIKEMIDTFCKIIV